MTAAEFKNPDLKTCMKESRNERMKIFIRDAIEYLRLMEKEYRKGKEKISGVEVLTQWLQEGTIKTELYLKMREAVENPETPYTITEK